MRFFASIFFAAVVATSASAQQIGTFAYNFSGTNTTTPTASITSNNATYVVSAPVYAIGGTGVSLNADTNALQTKGWTSASVRDSTNFVDIGFSTASGTNAYSLNTLTYNTTTNNNGPRQFDLAYALNGGATFTILATSPNITNGYTNQLLTFNFSDLGLERLSGNTSIKFRLFAYLADNNGNGTLSIATNGATNAVSIPFFAPVPEPTTVLGITALSIFGIGLIRKRLRK